MIDLTGQKIGMWTVIKELETRRNKGGSTERRWECRCDCGTVKNVGQIALNRKNGGGSRCCGCLGKQKHHATKSTKHYRRLYHVWHAMKKRCYKETDKGYIYYGARGIKICERWHDFANFYNDMIDTYKPRLSIERLDVDGDYCPENCIWIPLADQAKNTRSTLAYRISHGLISPQ